MDPLTILIRDLTGGARPFRPPERATPGSAGYDLIASIAETVTIPPGGWVPIPCGFALELPPGCEAQVRPRSGLAVRYGVTLLNSPGTIDPDYRGELAAVVVNHGQKPFSVAPGMRIAQLVVARLDPAEARFETVAELSGTRRGQGGFGHTGA